MSIYPSLEDMKMDHMIRAQTQYIAASAPVANHLPDDQQKTPLYPGYATAPIQAPPGTMYPELADFMGLELSPEVIEKNMPEYLAKQVTTYRSPTVATTFTGLVAPLSGQSLGLQRAQVTHGIRELKLCKGQDNKIGVRVTAINRGVFVSLVTAGSPAALAGLRFGDQIIDIQGTSVAGFDMDKVHDMLRQCPPNGIKVIVRDRPFERTITLHKDSTGRVGFHFKNGQITALVKDSSAARNGLLTEHHLLEVDGQNVVGLKDKQITAIIDKVQGIVTVTVMPSFLYEHMVKKMAPSLMKGLMDHSVPAV